MVRFASSSMSVTHSRILAPGRDEIDDEDDDQAVAHHRQADFPKRPPDARRRRSSPTSIISCGTSWNMLRMIRMLIDELQRDVGQDEAAGVVDQAEQVLGLVDADDRDDADREIERHEQRRQHDARRPGPQMHERVAREHRADRRDQHRAGGDVDAVEQVDRKRVDPLEDVT